jgi:predicted nucleic acid-binding protein
MFDTNIFDKLPSIINKIKNSTDKYEYYVTTIQVEELCEIPDDKISKRKSNILMLADLRAKLVPISLFILNGRAQLGYVRLGDGKVYHSMVEGNKGNSDDAIIADTAVSEGCTLITNDKAFYNRMKNNNYEVMTLEEFLAEIEEGEASERLGKG